MNATIQMTGVENVRATVDHFPTVEGAYSEFFTAHLKGLQAQADILVTREQAEALYFALGSALFDGDLSAMPLPERDNTKPADIDGPIHADMTPAEAQSLADRYANGVAAVSDNSVLEITD